MTGSNPHVYNKETCCFEDLIGVPNVTQPLSAKSLPFVLDHTFLSKAKTGEGTWQMIQAHSIKRNSSRAEKRIDESHMKKRIRRENSIFWFKVMFQNLEY